MASIESRPSNGSPRHDPPQLQEYGEGTCSEDLWRRCHSLLHSRCFVEGPSAVHQVAPGIDMANHSSTPNAMVRCVSQIRAL